MDTNTMDCIAVGIEVAPFSYPQPQKIKKIPDKVLKLMRKYKHNWRLDQLSKPMRVTKKYVSTAEGIPHYGLAKELKLDDDIKFYSDQLATPALKNIIHNKKDYSKISRVLRRNLTKNLRKAWKSIYNFYKNRERLKVLRQKRREAELNKGKAKPKTFERVDNLAKPKKVPQPPPPEKSVLFENYDRLDVLASPKVYIIQPPKRVGVNPRALTYEPTEIVFRLAKPPKRFENQLKPLEPGKVRRGALRYKITPRVEALSVPRISREKAKEDDDFDPWAISKNALKYKATTRILDLAKPRE